jgi:hypothetical protein
MGFSKETRTRALVAAARHCCVCHRYKGVRVEVHHLIPEVDGGDDSFENAITLCFDCHTDAGHYNDYHPRGSKFSTEELRLARDTWYNIVSEHHIHPPSEPDHFYCRYLICKDFEILNEIIDRNLSRLPIRNTVLVENAALGFLRNILNAHNEKYRRAHEWGVGYSDEKAYHLAHPDAVKIEKKTPEFAYYDMIRTPSYNELREKVAQTDGITRLLLSEGVSSEEIARALAFWDYCGKTTFQEEYRLRPLWGVFLAVTNLTPKPVVIESVEGFISGTNLGNFRSFTSNEELSESEWRLPASPLSTGMTAFIPIATVLAPLHHVPEHTEFTSTRDLDNGKIQEFKHVQFQSESTNEFRLWGPAIHPRCIRLHINQSPQHQNLHQLDLSSLYTIDRYWEMGSCPHLFFYNPINHELMYGRKLFGSGSYVQVTEQIETPKGFHVVIIAELEDEICHLDRILQENVIVAKDVILRKCDSYSISVSENSSLCITGRYVPTSRSDKMSLGHWGRNELVSNFLAAYKATGKSFVIPPSR